MANYVRFQRGSQEAYNSLKSAGRLNDYTLYFIYDPDNKTIGSLYMGSRLISGGDATVISSALKDLTDVVINNSGENYFLVRNANNEWVSTSLASVSALIKTELGEPDLSNLATKAEVEALQNKTLTLENSLNNKVDKVIYQVPAEDENGNPIFDEDGNPVVKEVAGTLVSPEDRAKLSALVLDEDGSGIEISGTVNAENVQGLGTWITTNGNTYIKQLSENNFSDEVKNKLNYITAVDTEYLTAVDGTLTLSNNTIASLNFIKSVDTDTFAVNDSKLNLIAVPSSALTPVLGDINLLPNRDKDFTLVDEINNLYNIITWSDIK